MSSMRLGTPEHVVVVGTGAAGLAVALRLSSKPVTLITQARLGFEAATAWAQGGIAAALGADDAPELHAEDTLAAGGGLSEPDVALAVARAAPACIDWLAQLGVRFDQAANGGLALGLEAAHRRRRIVHAEGDGTGAIALNELVRAVRATPSITVVENLRAVELIVDDSAVTGLRCSSADEAKPKFIPARQIVLATGGLGGLYAQTTNPLGAVGSGLALAARAGAVLRDLEFVQFHPTAIATGADPMPLATEAIRGEGAVLVNSRGERFMADIPGAELAPRDIVARAVFSELTAGERVFLDARAALGQRFANRFPAVTAVCRKTGLDPACDLIPVQPAAHYHMGGVRVDAQGRSSIEGLWACGEVASTGLHGANRLASNSLIEALAFARFVADDVQGIDVSAPAQQDVSPSLLNAKVPSRLDRMGSGMNLPEVRSIMTSSVGVIREACGLRNAIRLFARQVAATPGPSSDPPLVALLIATASLNRCESRGAHYRSDYPEPGVTRHAEITLANGLAAASEL